MIDLCGLPGTMLETETERRIAAEARRPFDLERGPLLRTLLLRRAEREWVLVVVMHHIASDGWSLGVLVRETAALYAAAVAGRAAELPGLPVQYLDYAVWQRSWLQGAALEEQLAWWRRELDEAPTVLELPADRPRPPVQSGRGAMEPVSLAALAAGMGILARREGATVFMVLLAGFQALLFRTAGQGDLLVGSPVANRTRVEIEGLIGFFVNTLALRGRPGEAESFRDLLAQVRASALGAFGHQDLPFERLVEELAVERSLARHPLIQVMLALQTAPLGTLELPGVTLEPLPLERGTAQLDLSLDLDGGLHGAVEYATDLFDRPRIVRMIGHLETLLGAALADPGRPLRDLPLLSAQEEAQLLAWSRSGPAGPPSAAVPDLVRAWAERTPEAEAVGGRSGTLTYRELTERSGGLARHLRRLGVAPEEAVGVFLDRSPGTLVALLGVLEAGAVYLPLDTAYPGERLAAMLADGGARFVVTTRELAGRLPGGLTPDPSPIAPPAAGRGAPPLVDGPHRAADLPHPDGDGAHLEADGAHRGADLPHLDGDDAHLGTDRLHFGAKRAHLGADRPHPGADRPHFGADHLHFGADHPHPGAPLSPLVIVSCLPSPGGRGGDGRGAGGEVFPEQTAYVIYTSGSTGRPKGVAVSHGALAAHCAVWSRFYGLGPGERVLQFAAAGFDASIEQMLPTLTAGATVVLRDGELWSPADFLRHGRELRLTVADVPTAWCQRWIAEAGGAAEPAPEGLRLVGVGGEELSPEAARRWSRTPLAGLPLINAYGPTEAVISATAYTIRAGQGAVPSPVPIGRPLAGRTARVLDRGGRPVPAGVPGELCLGGLLARGYLGRPAETAERFVPDPWAEIPGERLYRTGDLAAWREDGDLQFLGRIDAQLKIRGVRIEPGEVEAALLELPGVREAVVAALPPAPSPIPSPVRPPHARPERERGATAQEKEKGEAPEQSLAEVPPLPFGVGAWGHARERGPGGEGPPEASAAAVGPRLAAWVVPGPEGADSTALRAALAGRLPEAMIPAWIVVLDALPLTASGKVDRKALPAPRFEDGGEDAEAPRTSVEEILAGIWADLLGVERVPRTLSFFDAGGHSLLATQVVARVRAQLGVEVPLRALFEAPALADLAARVEAALGGPASAAPPLVPLAPASRTGPLPLSFAQERLWFLERLEPGSSAYHMPGALRLTGALDAAALHRALAEVVRRHEALRTAFIEEDGVTVQRVMPAAAISLPVLDLRTLPPPMRPAEAERRIADEARRPFDLSRPQGGSLLRALLVRLDGREWRLSVVMHHIVGDGWSVEVLSRELAALYAAFTVGAPSPLPALPVQYGDYAVWQRDWLRGDVRAAQLAYWRTRLTDVPRLQMPTDRPRPSVPSSRAGHAGLVLPAATGRALAALGRSEGATLFMTLLAGVQVLLGRYAGQSDVTIGTPVANRDRAEVQGLIGLFLNTLALRGEFAGDPSFGEHLARVRTAALEAFAHQDLPFELILEEVHPERSLNRTPLFDVLLNFLRFAEAVIELPGLRLEMLPPAEHTAKLDLTLYAIPAGERLELSAVFRADLFEAATVERLLGHLGNLLAAAADRPQASLSTLPLLSAAEREQLDRTGNRLGPGMPFTPFPAADAGTEGSIPARFARQAALRPDAAAVVSRRHRWTYAELDRRANRVARAVLERCGPGEGRVALLFEQEAPMLAALLGVLKAGKTYVPLDPAYPRERLTFMAEDAECSLLVTHTASLPLARKLAGDFLPILEMDLEMDDPGGDEDPGLEILPDTPAYILYTSGSTGRPKGVIQSHRNALHHARAYANALHLGTDDRVSLLASYSFDAAVMDTFGALLNGGTLCLLDVKREGTAAVPAWLAEQRITVFHVTPTVFRHVTLALEGGMAAPSLRLVVLGGEAATRHDLELFRRHVPPGCLLVNGFGPTESTVALQFFAGHGTEARGATIPVGWPVEQTAVDLLNERGEAVDVLTIGEMVIRSRHVALGYWRRPELTARAFAGEPGGERTYRTGDLGRRLLDGSLEFLGRRDHQVKIRGHRIEVEEVEATLARCPEAAEVAVVARPGDPGEPDGELRLVAYAVARPGHGLTPERLRAFARESLPEPMVPAAFVLLDAMPLTPTGKVQRTALPAPDFARPASEDAALGPLRTPTEEVLAAIWCEILKLDRVGADQSFFDLGGHSLLATQVVSRVRAAFGVELPLRALFEAPTVAELAVRVDAARGAGTAAQKSRAPLAATGERRGPLSFTQERLWFLSRLEPGSAAYHIPAALRLTGDLDPQALERALAEIVRRHAALHTVFQETAGSAVQIVVPPAAVALPLADLRGLPAALLDAEVDRCIRSETGRLFDLGDPEQPLLRALLLRLNVSEWVLAVVMHHIASDGWSLGVLVRETAALYSAFRAGEPSPLPELPLQYLDYAVWQRSWLRGEALEEQLDWWRRELTGAPTLLELPADRPRPPLQSHRGASVAVTLPAELTRDLGALARREGATLFMVLMAAFQVLLHRTGGQDDLLVGTPVANRTRVELEGLIGFFANTLVLRGRMGEDELTFRRLLERTRRSALGAFAHQDLPFERLVDALAVERSLSSEPLIQAVLVLQNAPAAALALPGATLETLPVAAGTAKLDLMLAWNEIDGRLEGSLEYATDLFDGPTAQRLLGHLRALLEQAAGDPDARIADLPLLTAAERHQALVEWNDTDRDYPRDVPLHRLFAAVAAARPAAVALRFRDEEVAYGELAARAHRLAWHLRSLGVGPEDRVALCLERSPAAIVALLAILAAGGAYVPLDPDLPAERLAVLLADSRPRVVLTDAAAVRSLPPFQEARLVLLDDEAEAIARRPASAPPDAGDGSRLAYVMYTSGSTGRPKGVAVVHRAVARLVLAQGDRGQDSVIAGGSAERHLTPGPSPISHPCPRRERGDMQDEARRRMGPAAVLPSPGDGRAGDGRGAGGEVLLSRPPALTSSWDRGFARFGPEEVFLQLAPLSFDASTLEIWGALLHGARLVLSPERVVAPRELGEMLRTHGVTTLWLTAGLFHQMVDENLDGLRPVRRLLAGGEPLSAPHVRRAAAHLPDCRIVDGYGPTEGTTFTACQPVSAPVGDPVPVGRPIGATRAYVLDRGLRPVPAGVAGELCAAGDGLARGYLDRPDLTAERFVPDPLSDLSGERLYRTGDRARLRPDGTLEVLGRLDRQVKIRGFRIEPGEVEAALAAHPAVRECAVVVREEATGKRLMACVVPRGPHPRPLSRASPLPPPRTGEGRQAQDEMSSHPEGEPCEPEGSGRAELSSSQILWVTEAPRRMTGRSGHSSARTDLEPAGLPSPGDRAGGAGRGAGGEGSGESLTALLREHLSARLPAVMVPSAWRVLDALPLTPNGKVDRRALERRTLEEAPASAASLAPRTPVEELVAGIWADVLHLDPAARRVGAHDSFFDLGGHSLLATQVISRLRGAFGVELLLRALFEAPTVAGLAARVEAALGERPVERVPLVATGAERGPLSFAQERLWFLDRLEPGSAAYNVPAALRIRGDLDPAALERTLEEIVRRHAALRTTFGEEGGVAVQRVASPRPSSLPLLDLRGLPPAVRAAEAERWITAEARRPFDLVNGPLFRALLVRSGDAEWVLAVAMHHIVSDGWSMGVLVRETAALYAAFRDGRPAPLPELPVQYLDYAMWQRSRLQGEILAEDLEWWRRELAGAPTVLELPADRPRPPVQSHRGASVPVSLPAEVTERVGALARAEGLTLFMVLLAAFQSLLHRSGGQEDVLVGTPVANRTRVELEGLIGFFVNTLVLRGRLAGDGLTFRDLLAGTRTAALGAFAHQDLPFERLVEELAVERSLSHGPLVQAVLALQNAPARVLELPGATLEPLPLQGGTAKFDLTLSLWEVDGRLDGSLEYATDLFDAPTARRLLGHLWTLLEGAVAAPEERIADLPLLTAAERHQAVAEWNDTGREYPSEVPLHRLFAQIAAARPEAPALLRRGEAVSYGELAARAHRLAWHLGSLGVRSEDRVAFCLQRSPEAVVAMLGILAAGAAYVPLDPDLPAERLGVLLADSRPRVVLTDAASAGSLPPLAGAQRVLLDEEAAAIARRRATLPPVAGDGSRLAYVMYTSGSTGRPKGVAVVHRAVARLVLAQTNGYARFGPDEVFLQLAPLSFDASTLEIWGALLHGARLVLAPERVVSPQELGEMIQSHGVTTLWLTTALFHQMVDENLMGLRPVRQLLAGGEAVSASHVRRVLTHLSGCRVVHCYGPTEGTTFTSCQPLDDPAAIGEPVPIGRPIGTTRSYVLDAGLHPVPAGVAGELFAGGDGLARGYLNRPDLTAERFVPDPVSGLPGERLYRTGDRVRLRPDGALEFLGRLDRQVKIRGFRIEPGEIEAVLAAHPAVRDCAVVVREEPAGKRLMACVVPWGPHPRPLSRLSPPDPRERGDKHTEETRCHPEGESYEREGSGRAELSPSQILWVAEAPRRMTGSSRHSRSQADLELAGLPSPGDREGGAGRGAGGEGPGAAALPSLLREHLLSRLPAVMVPSAWVVLDALPLTVNGKVDRRALERLAPEEAPAAAAGEAPSGPVEELVAGIWAELLGRPAVGRGGDFFAIGGHSLLAAQVISRVRRAVGVEVPLRLLFEAPTVAAFARAVEEERRAGAPAAEPIIPLPRIEAAGLPLSFAQERLWFLDRLLPQSPLYNVPAALRARGALDVSGFIAAVRAVVRRHEILRTTYGLEDGRPVQRIASDLPFDVPVIDLRALPAAMRETEARRLAGEEARRPFDLAAGPLLRVSLVSTEGNDERLVLVTFHHIVSDGWSLDVFVRDLAALYRAGVLPALPVQYADYAAWQRRRLTGEALEAELAHWRRTLAGAPAVLELPADRPRPPVLSYRGGAESFVLPAAAGETAAAFGRRHDATLFMVLLAVFEVLLARLTGREDLVVGTPVANRDRVETEGLIGFFMNTLPLRTVLDGEPGLAGLLPRVREAALAAYAHQEIPFEKLVEELKPARDLAHAPLVQVMFTLIGAGASPAFPDLEIAPLDGGVSGTGTAKFDLTLTLSQGTDGLAGSLEHNRDLFDAASVRRLAGHYATLLAAAVAAPERPLWELPMLTPEERGQILDEWNDTAVPLPAEPAVHRWIEAQARRRPGSIALVCEDRSLTYAELDARAGRLADRLRALGAGPERLTALCAERSPEMVIALLAVMKTGGAYVPLDPGHPRERLGWILEDTGRPLLLATRGERSAELAEQAAGVVWLEEEFPPLPDGGGAMGEGGQGGEVPDGLAYVIFTSGSTGRPKGVQVVRRGLANFLASMRKRPGLGAGDVLVAVTTLAFDIAGLELLLPLTVGARVVVASRDTAADGLRLAALLTGSGATAMQATPATWRLLLESGWEAPPGFKVLCGGEALPGELASRLAARGAAVWNLYGPTETTIWSAVEAVDATVSDIAAAHPVVPLGRPLDNTQIHLVGRGLEPVPAGVPGELLIGGAGVARGYVGRPDLTAERFVPDLWGAPGSRLYRTGDLARRLPDGRVEFLGRLDHQVKIRGHRIELGEIEAALAAHPAVRHAVVVDLPDSASGNGNRRLVAYAEVAEGETLGIGEVRRFLRARLPDYMLPAAFVALERLPLSPSGKVDRRALTDPSGARPALETEYAAPREGREAALAALWREVLGVERVGVHDNFFDLGGHSLLLMRLQGRIAAETGIDLPVLELFEHPTVASLARRLDARGAGCEEDGETADVGDERAGELRRGKERRARRLARRTSGVEV